MTFQSKQASSGGTGVRTTIVSSEHVQHVTLVDQNGNASPTTGGEPSSLSKYIVSHQVVPTTLTTGLNYFIIRNPDLLKSLKIDKITLTATFSGIAAATRSVYALKKLSGVSATTGTTINIAKLDSTSAASVAECKQLATGLTATGASDVGNITHITHANQLSANIVNSFSFESPVVLKTNEAIVLQSEGAVVAGSSISVCLHFYEI